MKRNIPITEWFNTEAACHRVFSQPRHGYLRSALQAATILTSVKDLSSSDRAYHQRVRDINLGLIRCEAGR